MPYSALIAAGVAALRSAAPEVGRPTLNWEVIADDQYSLIGNEVARRIVLSDPGIDDYRNELLWSPSRPTLRCR